MTASDTRTTMSAADRLDRAGTRTGPILALLFAANLLNFYDRTIPAIIVEPLKAEFGLSDAQIGLLSAAFTLVYAIVGIPLGRFADRRSRRVILSVGLVTWSLFTGISGLATTFAVLLAIRVLVGIGESSFAPAANSMIGDLYPSDRRGRAVGLLQLGLPLGLVLAFFTVGGITEAFGTWRAAFFIAAVPGLIIAVLFAFIREPRRGAAESAGTSTGEVDRPFHRLLRVRTLWWLVLAAIGSQVAAYAVATFSVPLFQRHFGMSLPTSGLLTGITIGLTGVAGLLVGGRIADRASRRSAAGRVYVGASALLLAAPLTLGALLLGEDHVALFVIIFSVGWLLQYAYYTAAYPAIADVVGPRLRGTAVSIYLAASYLLGGAVGPVLAGALSDRFAAAATDLTASEAAAHGLRLSLTIVIPASLLLAAAGLLGAARHVIRDQARMHAAS